MKLYKLAQPKILDRLAAGVKPWAFGLAGICLSMGLVYGLLASPQDYQQGDSVRIMYVHVPASWFALMIYGVVGVCSAAFLVFRLPMAALIARGAAPIGMVYTFISLTTGSIWGKPMWGTWWVWDARLTSMLVLFIMYAGYLLLAQQTEDEERAQKVSAILAVIGLINLPIIKFSVEWWHTLHQPASVLKAGGPSIHASMLVPLMWMAGGYFSLFVALLCQRIQTLLLVSKIQVLHVQLIQRGDR